METDCAVDQVTVSITPFSNDGGFQGIIYVKGSSDPACEFPLSDADAGTYELTLKYSECGGAELTEVVRLHSSFPAKLINKKRAKLELPET